MASLLVHAAVPLIVLTALDPPPAPARRLAIASVVCAWLPDVDFATFAFEIRATDLLGHRGLSHSLVVAAGIALACALGFFRAQKIGSRAWWHVVAFLFFATASHGLVDAMTHADVGVALLAPLENGRHFFPFEIVPAYQLGTAGTLSQWGILGIANELFYVVLPLAIVVAIWRSRDEHHFRLPMRTRLVVASWLAMVLVLRGSFPEYFAPRVPRVVEAVGSVDAGVPDDIPHGDLPEGKLVTTFAALRAMDLLEKNLAPANPGWSSSFFPAWYGGESGRWSEGKPRLVWRTLFGFGPPEESEARAWLKAANGGDGAAEARIFSLAPTEKLDLALGHFDFPITRQASASHGHESSPHFWNGRCNGVAAASLTEPEPFRVVDVVGVDGSHVRFHPNDVKALVAVAYHHATEMRVVGGFCNTVSFDPGATCSMNPAVLVMAIANRIGIAHQSFLVEAVPSVAIQYYAVAGATIHVAREPHPIGDVAIDRALAPKVASLVDVTLELTLSSTTLHYARADVPDPAGDRTRYARVGVVPVIMRYEATLALDERGELVGGRWTGDSPDGPDNVLFITGGPGIVHGDMLAEEDRIPWPVVRELARASIDEGASPSLDLRTACDGRCAFRDDRQ